MSSLRVLMVNKFHYLKGGSETYHFAVGEGLAQMGHEVAWFAMEDPLNLPCDQARFFVSAVDYNGRTSLAKKIRDGVALLYNFEAKRKFEALCEAFKPDVVHLNLTHRQLTFSILDAPYLNEHKVPVVYTAHDYIPICPNCTMLDGNGNVCDACLVGRFDACVRKHCVKGSRAKSALAAAEARFLRLHHSYDKVDCFIAPSKFMAGKLLEGGFDRRRVVYMQNFAKDEVLECARTAEDLTDRENPFLLFFGRLSREKGVDVLVEAFLRVVDTIPGWRLIIAGDGPERAAIEEMLSSSSQGGRVKLVGHLGQAEIQRYAERASLAIASSRCRENMPYSIIEALAAGTPVVGTRIGGIPELVLEGETGFVCEPDDVISLAAALRRGISICVQPTSYLMMQVKCRSYVLKRCDQSRYMKELVSLYESLALSRRSRNA